MRMSDWSSDVCSSDLRFPDYAQPVSRARPAALHGALRRGHHLLLLLLRRGRLQSRRNRRQSKEAKWFHSWHPPGQEHRRLSRFRSEQHQLPRSTEQGGEGKECGSSVGTGGLQTLLKKTKQPKN